MTWAAFFSLGIALSSAAGGCWLLDRNGRAPTRVWTHDGGLDAMTPVGASLAAHLSNQDPCGDAGAANSSAQA